MVRVLFVLIFVGIVWFLPSALHWLWGPMTRQEAYTLATYVLLAMWWVRAAMRHPEP